MMFVLGVFAVWRITSLFTNEDGPLDMFEFIREHLNPFGVFDCFWCTSLWVAIPFTLYLSTSLFEFILYLSALSAGAILLQELYE